MPDTFVLKYIFNNLFFRTFVNYPWEITAKMVQHNYVFIVGRLLIGYSKKEARLSVFC